MCSEAPDSWSNTHDKQRNSRDSQKMSRQCENMPENGGTIPNSSLTHCGGPYKVYFKKKNWVFPGVKSMA